MCVMLQLGASPGIARRASVYVYKYSTKYNVDPALVVAVMAHETRLRHFRRPNKTHDYGIMQIHCPSPDYAPWCSNLERLKKLKYNIRIGIYILSLWKNKYAKSESDYRWVRRYNWYNKNYAKKIRAIMEEVKESADECQRPDTVYFQRIP